MAEGRCPVEDVDRRQELRSNPDHGSPPSSPPPSSRKRDRSPSLSPTPKEGPLREEGNREYRAYSLPRSPAPGSLKRARNWDGRYYRRRGNPLGGYGSEDRRYGYYYGGGYELGGMRSRGWYGDERNYGRYMDRPSGRGNFHNSSGVTYSLGLMTFKQFIQELEDDISPAEAERRYKVYMSEYITTQKHVYFNLYKGEDWLKDKYHPTSVGSVVEKRNEHARSSAKELLLDLQNGTLDLGPGLTTLATSKSGNGSDTESKNETDLTGKRRYGRGPEKENDLLTSAPRAHPVSSETRRIRADVEQALALARKLDTEKGIEKNILLSNDCEKSDGEKSHCGSPIIIIRGLSTVKGLEGIELLDTLITYLWRVHGVDYYGMSETNEVKGLRHVREDNSSNDSDMSGADWEKKLDSFWQERLHGQDPLEILTAKDKIDAASVEALDPYVRKVRDDKHGWKYGCGAKGCKKLFHYPEYVQKHLKLKHPDLVMELASKVREDLYFHNYMNDQNAPGGTPVIQQPAQKGRNKHTVHNRLRDEHDIQKGYDRGERDSSRYERNDNSPTPDAHFESRGENPDEPIYKADGRQRLHAAPFPLDISPPILIPVPGAEVATQILREQGRSISVKENHGSRRRKGMPGPPLPPAVQLDPRRMQSYEDLDAKRMKSL